MPSTIDEAWGRIQAFLNMLPNDIERQKAVRTLRRRLAHPEIRYPRDGTVDHNQADLDKRKSLSRSRPAPPLGSSPPCVCGAPLAKHDPITGESDSCDGFVPVPN